MLLKIISVIFLFSFLYAFLEIIKRKSRIKREYTRKIAHLTSALLTIFLYFFLTKTEFLVTTVFFTAFFAFSYWKKLLDSIHLQNYKTFGEIFYPFSLIILGLFYFDKPFIIISAIAIMGFADGISGIYNLKHKKRSFRGSLIFFLVATTVLLVTYSIFIENLSVLALLKIIFISIIISIVEYISHFGSDNFTVPIFSAILLALLF